MKTLFCCVFVFCASWVTINLSHDSVKMFELNVQMEIAKAIGQHSPTIQIMPEGDDFGSRKPDIGEKRL
jgi:hypothetical protein